ncbi:MAG: hypothetical protein QT00_C0001G0272 [archaeon GW2011_AR5]|nr:MAG: hypothetical protein QT00_C0001G0272 [archaeon GW2011_AR5]
MKLVLIAFALLLAVPAFAAQGTTYGNCDNPLSSSSAAYNCYDKTETPYCPGEGLTYVRGWCPGGNNIQCCAPAGTPEGPRVGGPGLGYVGYCDAPLGTYKCYDINRHSCQDGLTYVRGWCLGGNDIQCCASPGTPVGRRVYGPGIVTSLPSNVQVQDFRFFLDGTGTCTYSVKSKDVETKRDSAACGSWVTITVGPNGDCRDEGENVCTVANGGESRTFSITFYRPSGAYGSCRKYTTSQCIDKAECTATGGTPIRTYCPSAPSNIECCIYQQTYAASDSFAYDATGTLSLSEIDNRLNLISQNYDAKIIIEMVDEIPPDAEQSMLNRFDFKYKLHQSGKKLTMIILYGKARNQWHILRGSENCGVEEATLRKIISDDSVGKKAELKQYDEAFNNLVRLLEAVIAEKSASGDVCREKFDVKDCRTECDSFPGCSMEKCVSIDGCMWNNNAPQGGACENICPGERRTEVVVMKKGEKCNTPNDDGGVVQLDCNDVYLCRNGMPDNPIKAAVSKTTASAGISSQCEGIPQTFIDKYNAYRDVINSKIEKYRMTLTDSPQALVAALISKESAWNENAESGSSTGIMQINVPVHPECDQQKIREHDVDATIDCGVKYLSNLARTQAGDVGRKVYDCKGKTYGTIEEVVLRYYNGWPARCLNDPLREDENFVEDIMGQRENPRYTANYQRWKACLSRQTVNEDNSFVLPEGRLEITEKATKGAASSCNIAGNYWLGINNNERSFQCVGMHDTECDDISGVFGSVAAGTRVTVKSSSVQCGSVCSGILESMGSIIDSSGCQKSCARMGCMWSGGACVPASLCSQEANVYGEVGFDIVGIDLFGEDTA